MDLLKPSYATGYAKNASQSAHPNLWDGLVGAWMPSLGVTGETLRDVSGNGNHGTLTNMDAATDWVGTSKGLALDFDGIDDTVQLKRRVELPSDMTFVCSLEFDQFNRMVSGSTDQYIAYFSSSTSWFFRTSVAFYQTLFPAFIASRTYDIALTRSGSDLTFWRDGKIIASRSGVLGSTSMEVLSGWSSTTQFRLNGRIGNTSVYNRALSPSEIKQLYVDSLAPFRKKQRVSVAVPAAVPTPSATYHPLRSLAHPLEQ